LYRWLRVLVKRRLPLQSSGLSLSLVAVFSLTLTACGGSTRAPVVAPGKYNRTPMVSERTIRPPNYYTVRRGDTLYSIAWKYGLDFRDVSRWNSIRAPYTIYPGQKIRLKPASAGKRKAKRTSTGRQRKQVNAKRDSEKKSTASQRKSKKQIVTTGQVKWSWPTKGRIVQSNTPISKNGIDISGKLNQQIKAAAEGTVVYSGSGLLGYGKLIIIKHNETYLSAYAHNNRLVVKEGERVKLGQHIAYMGKTTNGRVLLHFEVRKNGQPDNPLKYLPPP